MKTEMEKEVMNEDEDFDVELSQLSYTHEEGDKSVEVEIYSDGEGKWILEVLDKQGNSLVGDHHFNTDKEALEEFKKDLNENGIDFFIGINK